MNSGMRVAILTFVLIWTCLAAGPAAPTTDPSLSTKLAQIDERAGQIKSLSAHYDQQKFTALLRKPLESNGRIRIKGPVIRWDTAQPEPSVLFIDQGEARVYYPNQKTLEVYPLDKRLADLAASPLPRLDVLKERFSIEQMPVESLDKSAAGTDLVGLRLTPKDASIAEHIRQVCVLLDIRKAYIMKAEVTDSDGDRTVLSFKDVQLNVDVGDLALVVPPGTAVTHPLEGLNGQPPQSQGPSK